MFVFVFFVFIFFFVFIYFRLLIIDLVEKVFLIVLLKLRKEADDIGPAAELDHWKQRMAKFNRSNSTVLSSNFPP